MSNSITINNQSVLVKQYKGQRVLTFKDIDTAHSRPTGTARRNFNSNKKHFIEGEDYFVRNSSEAKKEFSIIAPNGIMLITESGYLMLAKSFTDELSWTVQRQLVNSYFKYKETKKEKQLALYNYFDKRYKGEAVLSSADVSHFTDINYSVVDWYARTYLTKGTDYYYLNGEELRNYKQENPQVSRLSSAVVVFTQSGFNKLCKAYGIEIETPELFVTEIFDEAKTRAERKTFDNDFLHKTNKVIPSNNMHSLMGYIQRDTAEIQYYSSLLLTTDKKVNHEANRKKLAKAIRHIRSYVFDVETILI